MDTTVIQLLMNSGIAVMILFVLGLFFWRWALPRIDILINSVVQLIITLREHMPIQDAKLDEIRRLAHESNEAIKASNTSIIGVKTAIDNQTEGFKTVINNQTTVLGGKMDLAALRLKEQH